MIRFGTSSSDHTARRTTAMSLHALCMQTILHGLRVCRIPAAYIAPLPEESAAPLRMLVRHYGIRLVVHAPIVAPYRLEEWFAGVVAFFAMLDATDGIIVCHLPTMTEADRSMFTRLPDYIKQHLAVEVTHQRPARLLADIEAYGVPVVFDFLHYQVQLPWPYEPMRALFACIESWGTRTPVVHISSQATAMGPVGRMPARGTHSDGIDVTDALWIVRTLLDANRSADIELEANGGVVAYLQLRDVLERVVPPLQRHALFPQNGETYATNRAG